MSDKKRSQLKKAAISDALSKGITLVDEGNNVEEYLAENYEIYESNKNNANKSTTVFQKLKSYLKSFFDSIYSLFNFLKENEQSIDEVFSAIDKGFIKS